MNDGELIERVKKLHESGECEGITNDEQASMGDEERRLKNS